MRTDPAAAVTALLRAGISSFIDLTQEKEMTPYEALLQPGMVYRRFPIIDHGLPRSTDTIAGVLAAIDSAFDEGRSVYVHCRAGIGRTGVAIACYLINGGLSAEQALTRLQVLWKQNARSATWLKVPETDEQVAYVRRWRAPPAAPAVRLDLAARAEGAMIGLAMGDALGRLLSESGGNATQVLSEVARCPVLATGAHTAMTRAVAESLQAHSGQNPADQLQRYLQWTRAASGGAVPAELKRALATWQWSRKPLAGSHDPKNLDGHSIPRTLAVALFANRASAGAQELAVEVSRVTQQSPAILDLCRLWVALLLDTLAGTAKTQLLSLQDGPQLRQLRQRQLRSELNGLLTGEWQSLAGGSNAIAAVAAALVAVQGGGSFQAGMSRALVLSKCPGVAAPLYGSLAGALFGVRGIPQEWSRRLQDDAALRALARQLVS
jgi:ADP-ribosylglycohydrolase